ncbi:hypothetical protein DAETH_37170 (plasmid) [Deinococcus aetherius]|uniref:Uncharacterized protein n=1 Tax=Deinococcus aetherius TaxID=200252 RepID=A0ABM8AIV7_9DEIO|nr:hypothetical protein [Deinococcus aetherius]BDP43748.1 hypothetical protein DAETH_37170 [Deinococcus aetherius]
MSVIGHERDVQRAVDLLGEVSREPLELDRRALDMRRVFKEHAR